MFYYKPLFSLSCSFPKKLALCGEIFHAWFQPKDDFFFFFAKFEKNILNRF